MRLNGLGFFQKLARIGLFSILGFSLVAMSGWDSLLLNEDSLIQELRSKGEIVVLTTRNPLIYQQDKNGSRHGIDYELLIHFAKQNGVALRFIELKDQAEVLEALRQGKGDLAAARLPAIDIAKEGFLVGPALEETHLSLFCHKKANIQNLNDLSGHSVALLEKDNLDHLDNRIRNFIPGAQLKIIVNSSVAQVLNMTAYRDFDCAIAENLEGSYFSQGHTSLEKVASASNSYSLSWLLSPDNQNLNALLKAWYQEASRKGDITKIQDHYDSFLTKLDLADVRHFLKALNKDLPKWEKAFKKAGEENNIDWHLTAVVAYQESHWDADAHSYTGVRGLMQLTEDTAERVGVTDRRDPIQSIKGGTYYLRALIDTIPATVNKNDRQLLALAAYNIGYGHLLDAQKLAQQKGLDPWSWQKIKTLLPLLEDENIASQLEYGTARGNETVEFVERVNAFENLWRAIR